MKKYRLMAAMLALFLLTACGQSKPAGTTEQKAETPPAVSEKTETAPPAAPETAEKPAVQTAPETPSDRPKTTELEFTVEGLPETVPATLYVGEGWSIYIPDEGWRLDDRERDDGAFQTVWENTGKGDAELWVLNLGQRTLAEAQVWFQREEDDYVFQEDKQGGLLGTDAEDRDLMEVRFHEGGDLFAVVWTYRETAAEGFGTRLSVMADTFEITS